MRGEGRAADDGYAPVETAEVWPVLSLLCFATSLGARLLSRLVPRSYRPYPWGVLLPVGIAASLALLGIVFALVGLARQRGRGLARVALLVNAIVLLLTALAALAMLYILRR